MDKNEKIFLAKTAGLISSVVLFCAYIGYESTKKSTIDSARESIPLCLDVDGDERKDIVIEVPNQDPPVKPLVYLQQPDGSYLPLQIVEEKLWNQLVNPARDLDARVQHSLDALHQK